jgi:hypothetical protein
MVSLGTINSYLWHQGGYHSTASILAEDEDSTIKCIYLYYRRVKQNGRIFFSKNPERLTEDKFG